MYTCIKHTVKFKFINYLKLKYCVIHAGNVLKQLISHFNNLILNDYGVFAKIDFDYCSKCFTSSIL